MRRLVSAVIFALSMEAFGQGLPGPAAPARVQVEGQMPAVLKIRVKTATLGEVDVTSGVKRPVYVAPSAIAYGHSEFSPLPPRLSFFAGLAERGNTAPKAILDTVEIQFEAVPPIPVALDVTQGEVLVGPVLAKRLRIEGETGTLSDLPPFRVGPLLFSGVRGRRVAQEGLPGEAVEAVLPLALFEGFGVYWEPSAGRLTLYAAGSAPTPYPDQGAFAVAASWERGALCFATTLQEKTEGRLLVNPAQPHSVIDLEAARRAGIGVRPRGEVVRNEIVKGGLADEARIRLGPTRVAIRSARLLDIAGDLPPGTLGILGREVFGLFRYSFEPGASTVRVIPPRKGGSKEP